MIDTIKKDIETVIASKEYIRKLPEDRYSHMKYPKLIPLMRFNVEQYDIEGIGHLMTMHTTTGMGMELLTVSLMPSTGIQVPYLLIDAMTMKEKRCVFAEYYGCGHESLGEERFHEVFERYKDLPSYSEKENWYINERENCSLIKSGDPQRLAAMAKDSFSAWLTTAENSVVSGEYRKKLVAFRERMISEGNPSSKTLNMLLGKDGAAEFMKKVIMPVE